MIATALAADGGASARRGLARVSSDPVQPKAAIDFFRGKSPVTREVWDTLTEDARKRAFTVAWTTKLSVLQGVKDALDKAIADGTTFEQFKKDLKSGLASQWSTTGPHLETIFRNNVQSAYAAGRYKAQTSPAVLKVRPYWRLVVLLDEKTSPYCKPLASPPVVLPADHPWWASNFPPRHHRCRATTVTLTKRQAERYGVLAKAPPTQAQDGWGSTEGLGEWQPDRKDYDPALFDAAKSPSRPSLDALPERDPDTLKPSEPMTNGQMMKHTRANVQSAPEEVMAAVLNFTGGYYGAIKDVQRGLSNAVLEEKYGDRVTDAAKRYASVIDDLFKHAKPDAMRVYRGLADVSKATAEAIVRSKEIKLDSITSASRLPSIAQKFALSKADNYGVVFVLNQHSGVGVEGVSMVDIEREVVLAKGRRFRIDSVTVNAKNKQQLIVEATEL